MKLLFFSISKVFHALNFITPKFSKFVTFSGYPDYDDTLKGMIPYLPCDAIILVSEIKKTPSWVPHSFKIVKKNSLKGSLYIFLSKKIYYTHGLFSFFKLLPENRQLVINLWHGMPLKNIGYLDGKKNVPQAHYLLSTSKSFQVIMAEAFGMDLSRVKITGLPRNDLLSQNGFKHPELESLIVKYRKVHVWLPTYRSSGVGDIRKDGSSSSIFGIDDFCPTKLNELLIERNELVILKPHPMALIDKALPKASNILFINEDWLHTMSLTLYELLSISDSLWTDYSSVAVDYLLLRRKIILIMSDIEAYKSTRGFTSIASDIPAIKVYTEQELLTAVTKQEFYTEPFESFHQVTYFDNENVHPH